MPDFRINFIGDASSVEQASQKAISAVNGVGLATKSVQESSHHIYVKGFSLPKEFIQRQNLIDNIIKQNEQQLRLAQGIVEKQRHSFGTTRREFMVERRMEHMMSGMIGAHSPIGNIANQFERLKWMAERAGTTIGSLAMKALPMVGAGAAVAASWHTVHKVISDISERGKGIWDKANVGHAGAFKTFSVGMGWVRVPERIKQYEEVTGRVNESIATQERHLNRSAAMAVALNPAVVEAEQQKEEDSARIKRAQSKGAARVKELTEMRDKFSEMGFISQYVYANEIAETFAALKGKRVTGTENFTGFSPGTFAGGMGTTVAMISAEKDEIVAMLNAEIRQENARAGGIGTAAIKGEKSRRLVLARAQFAETAGELSAARLEAGGATTEDFLRANENAKPGREAELMHIGGVDSNDQTKMLKAHMANWLYSQPGEIAGNKRYQEEEARKKGQLADAARVEREHTEKSAQAAHIGMQAAERTGKLKSDSIRSEHELRKARLEYGMSGESEMSLLKKKQTEELKFKDDAHGQDVSNAETLHKKEQEDFKRRREEINRSTYAHGSKEKGALLDKLSAEEKAASEKFEQEKTARQAQHENSRSAIVVKHSSERDKLQIEQQKKAADIALVAGETQKIEAQRLGNVKAIVDAEQRIAEAKWRQLDADEAMARYNNLPEDVRRIQQQKQQLVSQTRATQAQATASTYGAIGGTRESFISQARKSRELEQFINDPATTEEDRARAIGELAQTNPARAKRMFVERYGSISNLTRANISRLQRGQQPIIGGREGAAYNPHGNAPLQRDENGRIILPEGTSVPGFEASVGDIMAAGRRNQAAFGMRNIAPEHNFDQLVTAGQFRSVNTKVNGQTPQPVIITGVQPGVSLATL
jgi:hypothetical protein